MDRHAMDWQVTFRVFRYKQDGAAPRFDLFVVRVNPDEYVIDAIERVWAEQDRSLVFRHACHHGACGSCGMRINGHEKLPCVLAIRSITTDGGMLTLEPLRNLPVVSDLMVNMTPFYERMEWVQFTPVRIAEPIVEETSGRPTPQPSSMLRYEDCLECGLCFSACPIAGTDPEYVGPAALAAMARMIQEPRDHMDIQALLRLADSEHGCWRCHTAFECSEVCPTGVDPARSIAALRRKLTGGSLDRLFRAGR
jgi:succinate dehydrogenase / fumarate reductase iron-sulfur subunit